MESASDFIKRKNREFLQKKKPIGMKDIGGRGKHYFEREAWTFLQQHNLDEKVFVFERLRKKSIEGEIAHKKTWKKGEIEYRIGYYIVGKIGKRKGKWTWGQFCPMIPHKDLIRLIKKAKEEGVIK